MISDTTLYGKHHTQNYVILMNNCIHLHKYHYYTRVTRSLFVYVGKSVILRHVRNGTELAPIDQNLYYDFDYQVTNHITPRVVQPVSTYHTVFIYLKLLLIINGFSLIK